MIIELTQKPGTDRSEKLNKHLTKLEQLLQALGKKDLSEKAEQVINTAVHAVNHFHGNDRELAPQVKTAYSSLYNYVTKELNLVPKGFYQQMWIALGMVLFGMPLGIAMGTALDNFAFIGIGLPIGLPIGIAIGNQKDKKAEEEGRQLDMSV